MQKCIEDILYNRRSDIATLPLRIVLRLFAAVYGTVIFWRNFLYNKQILKSHTVPCRVISVGNIVIGGTGKTPVVIMTAKMLKETGVSVAVVSRGYKRKSKHPLVVSDGSSLLASPLEAGDEPHIISCSLDDVPVVVGRNRYNAASLAYKRFKPDVIILDDAMQHRRLYRDVDIVTMDADNPIGSEYLLPRGLLRESPYSIKRAKAVVVTRVHDEHNRERIERMVRYYHRNAHIFWSRHIAKALRKPGSSDMVAVETIRSKRIAALSNVVNPDSFYHILESHGAEIVVTQAMPDHHQYTSAELEDIETESRTAGAEILIMTTKDERNLPEGYGMEGIQKYVLDIETEIIENVDDYMKLIAPYKQRA